MNKNWKDMNPTEKKLTIAACIYALIALVFVVLDLGGVWKNDVCTYMFSVFFLAQGALAWKENNKMAILDLAVAVLLLLSVL